MVSTGYKERVLIRVPTNNGAKSLRNLPYLKIIPNIGV